MRRFLTIFCLLAFGLLVARAEAPNDKFDLSITGAELKGNALSLSFKIVNQSAGPVKIDLTTAVIVNKANPSKSDVQPLDVPTRPDIYKARLVLLSPEDKQVFFTPKTSKSFAPQVIAAGATLTLTKDVPLDPASFLKILATEPYGVFLSLAFQTPANPSCQGTPPSPIYKITLGPDGKLVLSAPSP